MTDPTITDADRALTNEIERKITDDSDISAGNAAQYAFDSNAIAAIIARHRAEREKQLENGWDILLRQIWIVLDSDEGQSASDAEVDEFDPWDALRTIQQREKVLVEALRKSLIRAYTHGYGDGHEDTVEGTYTDVQRPDLLEYFRTTIEDMILDGSLPEASQALKGYEQ